MAQLTPSNGLEQLLLRYILDYHPYMDDDRKEMIDFIVMRAEAAEKAHREAFLAGESGYQSEITANQVLYAGLHFSPVTYLIEIGDELHGYEMTKSEASEIYRIPEVKALFDKYGQEIEGDPREPYLIEELKPFLDRYKGKGKNNGSRQGKAGGEH
jgi:hypothetical protein